MTSRTQTAVQGAWLRLARVPGLDIADARSLLARLGGPEALLAADEVELARAGVARAGLSAIAYPDEAALERDLRWLDMPGHCLLTADDPGYPPQLAATRGAPLALFVRGRPSVLSLPQLAIVGSRSATAAGRETAFEFAARLSAAGLAITSGLATGIDAAAHRGALAAGGMTIAVCGTGLDLVYPAEHAALAASIAIQGALVSEFSTATAPVAANFPRRNRLLSGLARGVLVIEAAERSGSLITARLAGDQGRDVMAVPGSIHNALARGCHRLIKDGAALVESPEDVLATIGFTGFATASAAGAEAPGGIHNSNGQLDSAEEMLLNALGFEPADLDKLVERTGFPAHAVASMMQMLELEGRIESLAGGRYSRTPPRQAR
ncbi:MAG: DNA-processing protein DprA [Gammaproteobacteria bacterium]|nr:DNA-processing protein DprA [Gammaproteobacteria bacterium]